MRLSYLLVALLMLPCTFGAVIEGTVYDLSLDPAESVVQIDTAPQQRMVAADGMYRFSVPLGDYRITAEGAEGSTAENLTIVADGTYNIDLFLFPDLSEEVYDGDEVVLDAMAQRDWNWGLWIGIFIGILAVTAYFWKRPRERKSNPDARVGEKPTDVGEILAIIKAHDGRMTQKALRDKLPHSEAKVSLMLAELEAKGTIEKIKRGRSNILLLK